MTGFLIFAFIIIVAVSLYLAWRSMREMAPVPMVDDGKRLLLEITDQNIVDKDFFDNLYRLAAVVAPQSCISVEMLWRRGFPHYFVYLPEPMMDFLKEENWYRILNEGEDYSSYINPDDAIYSGAEFSPKESYLYPIEPSREMSTLVDHFSNEDSLWFQTLIVPVSNTWQSNARGQINQQVHKNKVTMVDELRIIVKNVLKNLVALSTGQPVPASEAPSIKKDTVSEPTEDEKTTLDAIERKIKSDGFEAKMRMIVVSNTQTRAHELLQELATRLSEVSGENGLNKLIKAPDLSSPHGTLFSYRKRYFPKAQEGAAQSILTSEELSKLFNWKAFGGEVPAVEMPAAEVPAAEIPAVSVPATKPYIPEIPTLSIPTMFDNLPVMDEEETRPEVTIAEPVIEQKVFEVEKEVEPREKLLHGEKIFYPGIKPESISGEIVFQ